MDSISIFLKNNNIRYIPLLSIGVDRFGFEKEEAQKVLNFLKDEVIPILGIDVYIKQNDKIQLSQTYDNWYSIRIENENFSDYANRTYMEALSFIKNYHSASGTPIFDICSFDLDSLD